MAPGRRTATPNPQTASGEEGCRTPTFSAVVFGSQQSAVGFCGFCGFCGPVAPTHIPMNRLALIVAALLALPTMTFAQRAENDFSISNFKFASGESLPSLHIHYTALGTARKD